MSSEDVTGCWDIESVFIEKILKELPVNFNFNVIMDHLIGVKTHNKNYKIWSEIRDKTLLDFIDGSYVYFEVGHYTKKILVSSTEILAFKEKLRTCEVKIVQRARNISFNESIHDDDELWEDR